MMHITRRASVLFGSLLALALGTPAYSDPAPTDLTDLGTLGGSLSYATAINDQGEVVGTSNVVGDIDQHAFLYAGGTLTDLDTLGGTYSSPFAINAGGQVAGLSYVAGDTEYHAFLTGAAVVDTTPPTITVTGLPAQLSPANHKLVRIRPTLNVADDLDPAPVVTLVITSDEPDHGVCDGDTRGDIVIRTPTDFDLRAERSAKGNGRTYTLVWTVTDASGNGTTLTTTVFVLRTLGRGKAKNECHWKSAIHHDDERSHRSHRKGGSEHR